MAALAARAVYTRNDFTVNNNTRAYARAESYGNKVLSAVTAARISLAESSAIGIVFNKHRNIFKAVFEHFFCMNIVKAEIICKFNNAIFIYRARCAHTGA